MIRIAAEKFAIKPNTGVKGDMLTREKVTAVFSDLKAAIFLIEDEHNKVCLLCCHSVIYWYPYSNLLRKRVAEALGISKEQVFCFESHNHTSVVPSNDKIEYGTGGLEDIILPENKLTPEGKQLIEQSVKAAGRLPEKLAPVQIWWGLGHERRISYNRKGRRADGSTYFMREEDRLLLGKDFNGDIEDDAPVVAFIGKDNKPVAMLAQFTAHPVTSYVPGHATVFGEYPQVACDDLSEAFGGIPVGFLQGCAGDQNCKGLLSGKTPEESVADATKYGHCLGGTYIKTARQLQRSVREDLAFVWEWVRLPFKKVPPVRALKKELAEIDDFIARCEKGDENTRACIGLNFPSTMPPRIRGILLQAPRRWMQWALSFHANGRLDEAPKGTRFLLGALRIGDVGIVGMPCEPFAAIGRQIKHDAGLALAIPCGYMHGCGGYVADGPNNGDTEYMSSFYRYTRAFLPYKNPAGDLLARAGVRMLKRCAKK